MKEKRGHSPVTFIRGGRGRVFSRTKTSMSIFLLRRKTLNRGRRICSRTCAVKKKNHWRDGQPHRVHLFYHPNHLYRINFNIEISGSRSGGFLNSKNPRTSLPRHGRTASPLVLHQIAFAHDGTFLTQGRPFFWN